MITSNIFRYTRVTCLFKRFKHKDSHWSVERKKKTCVERALEHFDDFYKDVFRKDWLGIRQGLLGQPKYVAVVNNYSDSDKIRTNLENIGALNLRTMFDLEKRYIKENQQSIQRKKLLRDVLKLDKEIDERIKIEDVKSNPDENNSRIIFSDDPNSNANLYEFIPASQIKGMEDFITESDHYKYFDNSEFPVGIEKQYDIHFPENLNVYFYDTGNFESFESPSKGSTGVYDYYLMDGGSVLPILALDIRPGDRFLDMCSSPGGKSFLSLQTLYPDQILCNDVTKSRVDRVFNVMRQYLYDFDKTWLAEKRIRIQTMDARFIKEDNFDKVLVDVPCTTDRHSAKEELNNIFRADRVKERLKLPELQCELLFKGLKLVKKGGTVVYSTCSLSPIQNDGVVHMALKKIWEDTRLEFKIVDLTPALMQTQSVYRFANHKLMKYGHLVIPNLNLNFGPTYFCKLQRVK